MYKKFIIVIASIMTPILLGSSSVASINNQAQNAPMAFSSTNTKITTTK